MATTQGCEISFAAEESDFGGSDVKTSIPAPAIWPDSRVSSRASSSIIPPRATLRILAPFFILLSSPRLIIPLVLAIKGVWMVKKSET